MSRLVYDLETNHYDFKVMSKLHCIAVIDVDTKEEKLYVDGEFEECIDRLENADELIAHNQCKFDLPALKIFFPKFNPKGKIRDTRVFHMWIESRDSGARSLHGDQILFCLISVGGVSILHVVSHRSPRRRTRCITAGI